MANYYEMIEQKPSATDKEIETAIDVRYNQWRALVTHHDDKVRDQANQAMRMLEQIRATLSDPAKRAVYDEAIGVRGATAGLVDPNAVLNVPRVGMPPPPPPRSPASKPVTTETGTSKLWACQKCGEKNPEHTQFCYNCGTQLVRECPRCKKNTSLVATGFCGSCGANFDEAKKRIELRVQLTNEWNSLAEQQRKLVNDSNLLKTKAQTIKTGQNRKTNDVVGVYFILGLGLVSGGLFLCVFILAGSWIGLFGIPVFFGGLLGIYLAIRAIQQESAKRKNEIDALERQALEGQNKANALATPIMRIREQLKTLED